MKIELERIKIKDLIQNFKDTSNEPDGDVVGFGGVLNIRPKYQREFVYKDEQRKAVIDTIMKGFPLNSIYWVKNGENAYEVLDGQQRTLSICQYSQNEFSLNELYFHNLSGDKKEKFLNYELMVYICEGSDSEKLEWFKIINIAGEKLTNQELRNAVYTSEWLSDAKKYFSKKNSLAKKKAEKYLKGSENRQDFLESALAWIVNKRDDRKICEYMARASLEQKNADELWAYFCAVIEWVEMKFSEYRKEMKGLEWGLLYNRFKDKKLDSKELESEISKLMQDSEVQKKSGIYEYVLSGDERCLNLRAFDDNTKRIIYEAQGRICANKKCSKKGEVLDIKDMEADHIIPWSKGGKTTKENCQMLCRECNRAKSSN